jgi:aminoglycoside/choline kinase family phosphotransferase
MSIVSNRLECRLYRQINPTCEDLSDAVVIQPLNSDFQNWIEQHLPPAQRPQGALTLAPLAGDAGFRRYFRVDCAPSLIAVNAPPAQENNLAFVQIANSFVDGMIRVPKIHAVDFARGFMLLEDLGRRVLQPLLDLDSLPAHYGAAETVLLEIQQLAVDRRIYPIYDAATLDREMRLFEQWFVTELLGIELSASEKSLLGDVFQHLIESAEEQPQVVVHRDYHSRNLMLLDDGELGIIDFQDAVLGPMTYDLVSLLKDCYVRWPAQLMARRALDFKRRAEALGTLVATSDEDFLRWFDWMGLQRHIKVMGVFARLALRDNKRDYLQDLPRVIDYSLEAASRYPQLRPFGDWFRAALLPQLSTQPWFSDSAGGPGSSPPAMDA